MLWTKFKYNKGQELLNYTVMILVHCISLHRDIYLSLTFQVDTFYTCNYTKFKCEKFKCENNNGK